MSRRRSRSPRGAGSVHRLVLTVLSSIGGCADPKFDQPRDYVAGTIVAELTLPAGRFVPPEGIEWAQATVALADVGTAPRAEVLLRLLEDVPVQLPDFTIGPERRPIVGDGVAPWGSPQDVRKHVVMQVAAATIDPPLTVAATWPIQLVAMSCAFMFRRTSRVGVLERRGPGLQV